jgi:tetratricopeptide (TPR) repeat protein
MSVPRSVPLLLLALLATGSDEAWRAFERGDPRAAAEYFRVEADAEPGSPVHRYNLGTSLLAAGEYEEARAHLAAAATSGTEGVDQAAFYNLGNSFLHPAFPAEPSPERRELLLFAVDAYRNALLLDPDDFDAKWNLELALRLLEEDPPEPSPDAPEGGGGGSGESTREGELGDPEPQPADGAGPQPRLTPEEAERMISAAEEREVGTQQERLRRAQPPVQGH